MSHHLSWLESGVIGLVQGVSELFPVSSLGHSVLIPAWVGGSWARDLDISGRQSPYLSFIVGLHVATAIALIVFFWRDWVRIIGGLATSIVRREVRTTDQRLAWLLVLATIPVGLVGLVAESFIRDHLAKPLPTSILLACNGLLLLGIEHFRRSPASGRHAHGTVEAPQAYVDERASGPESDERLARLPVVPAVAIGAAQILALGPGLSRSGSTMAAGLLRGLSREDAARFAFLLATPVILAAGVLKLPELTGSEGAGIRGQILFGSVLSGVGAYLSVRFLTRYFATRTMRPFGWYCLVGGLVSAVYFGVK